MYLTAQYNQDDPKLPKIEDGPRWPQDNFRMTKDELQTKDAGWPRMTNDDPKMTLSMKF